MLENYITKNEISMPRTPNKFISWFEEKLNIAKYLQRDSRKQHLLHQGYTKYFHEELFPLYRLLQNKLETWNDINFIPILGNQNFDVKVESSGYNFPKYIEITQADMNEQEHLRMMYFFEHGSVNMVGKVTKEGTKKTGLKFSVEDECGERSETNLKKKSQIKEAIEKKQKVKENPAGTALLVYFDDYIAFSQDKERKEMDEFLDTMHSLWNNRYMRLFVVGASGKRFWEKEF